MALDQTCSYCAGVLKRSAYLLYTCASMNGVGVVSFWVVGMPMALIMRYKTGFTYLSSLYQNIGRRLQPDERCAQAVCADKATCN